MGNGQIRYDGVWERSTVAQTHIFAESIYKFAEQFNAKQAAGQHAVLMHSVRGRLREGPARRRLAVERAALLASCR
ncbi:hypothetical protein BE08_06430 [Sorangium cellulosum]|uniref:Uncharacterized protein n=1 Tax=Sorangium cellulosum TaxID=56 RepID=A0A150PIJ9_SORCE|nr:hypothetical protein BE08_06430 [Sorangium cellulosum]